MQPHRVFIFGDQTGGFATGLQQLLLDKTNPSLVYFVDHANLALRQELSRLPSTDRETLPLIGSVQDILTLHKKGERNVVIDSILSTVYHLACFIYKYGNAGCAYPNRQDVHVTGMCVGSLAAAAVSCSRSIGDVIVAGIVAIRAALRVGLRAHQAALLISNRAAPHTHWSYAVSTESLRLDLIKDALEKFAQDMDTSPLSHPYISAIGLDSVTVSGPPSHLHQFWRENTTFHKPIPIPIWAPYHGPHIFGDSDVETIIESLHPIPKLSQQAPIISSGSGVMASQTLADLIRAALRDILLHRLDLPALVGHIKDIFRSSPNQDFAMTPIATNAATSLVATTAKAAGNTGSVDNEIMDAAALAGSASRATSAKTHDSKIAIIGMSGRFPEAADLDSFWSLLEQGVDAYRPVPPDRFDAHAHHDETGRRKNTSKVLGGCWINQPGLFDPKFFSISPKEAEQSDPAQRLALQTAYEALEMAGVVPDRTQSTQRDRVGVFYGMVSDDWREINSGQNIDTYFIPGMADSLVMTMVHGPSITVDTACSSSLAAIHVACNSLWRGDCDTAVAGGVNVLTNPDIFAGLDRGHFLSTTGNCKTFDDDADGYCRADGVGTVILKRLEDAVMDKDPILAVLNSAYTNHSAEAVSITRPHAGAQELIFSKLLRETGIHPHDVSYIEMHGTGTQAGDATEMSSVLRTFAPDTGRLSSQTLHLGSAKSNVGHGEAASGVTSLIKVLLMMKHNTIPPHCGIKGRINHRFPTDLRERNVFIASQPVAWNKPHAGSGKRRVFINNFSAAGGNSALLLEDAPTDEHPETKDPRSTHIVAVSAKSSTSLANNLKRLRDFVQDNIHDLDSLSKLSYTTTARRIHYPFRAAMAVSSRDQLLQGIESVLLRDEMPKPGKSQKNIGFVFSGQGAQYAGMGRHLFHNNHTFRTQILACNQICLSHGFPSILEIFKQDVDMNSLEPLLVQLGTTCLQMSLVAFWKSLGVTPDFCIGHSLGEYAALQAAGVLSVSDTIYLTGIRARMLQEKCSAGSHAMLAVRAPLARVNALLDPAIHEVTCLNGPQDVVIGGRVADVEELEKELAKQDIKAVKVSVPFAFHSTQVEPILGEFCDAARGVPFQTQNIPVISTLLGEVVQPEATGVFGPGYLKRHCREPVNFAAAVEAARDANVIHAGTVFVEIGPHPVCLALLKSNMGPDAVTLASLHRKDDGWKVLADTLAALYQAGLKINWDEVHRDFASCQEVLPLPSYSWDNKNYWIQYVHNWTLTKGDEPAATAETTALQALDGLTSSVQKIIRQTDGPGSLVTIVVQSDFGSARLAEVAQGHKVNGEMLCTSSLYAEIGMTLGRQLLEKYRPDLDGYSTEIKDMSVDKPLILKDENKRTLFRAEVVHDKSTHTATMSIYSVDSAGNKTVDHARCLLRFADPTSWLDEWERTHYLIDRSVRWLEERAEQGTDSLLSRGIVYKLFSSLVDYSPSFKGLQEVILNSGDREAAAKVRLQAKKGDFDCNPMWIDSFGQLTGFLMNGHDFTGKDEVFINHGWRSMRCAKPFRKDAVYRTYIRMQHVEKTKYRGDLYIIEDGVIVAVFGGMTFLGMSRSLLNKVLPPRRGTDAINTAHPVAAAQQGMAASAKDTERRPLDIPTRAQRQPSSAQTGTMGRILAILSKEVGLSMETLTDDLVFADYGVDSLLSLTITGRIREELGLDMDSSIFTHYSTLGELKAFLGADQLPDDAVACESSNGQHTPQTSDKGSGTLAVQKTDDDTSPDMTLNRVCAIIAEEVGISVQELSSSQDFQELGIDSLSSLTILSRVREELQLDLESDFFDTHPSFYSLQKALCGSEAASNGAPEANETTPSSHRLESDLRSITWQSGQNIVASPPHATSILVSGSPSTARMILVLFPDGSGSAASYGALAPKIRRDIAVYALNCPWRTNGEEILRLGVTLDQMVAKHLVEVGRILDSHRHGRPGSANASVGLALGGWSAGGILALEAVRQLGEAGVAVQKMVLLDAPNPIGLQNPPPRMFHFLDELGILGAGKGKAPAWVLRHFDAMVNLLKSYRPRRLGAEDAPKCLIVYAKDGICKDPDGPRMDTKPDDAREMLWLLYNRVDFSAEGWKTLVGQQNLAVGVVDDVNHFSMMNPGPKMIEMGNLIGEFLLGPS
ncbi:polyketide synthase, DHN melanin biosynthesis [Metarhizium robertsii]|uniref:Polyketide synthase 2 n=1 Tax=Metarhizium robertsii TaxID=568076 RepID=A0A0A1UYW4_9HYPO|nr:polyketide synthase, DHN melanin biosynthesis [Metarhizium robertsii]